MSRKILYSRTSISRKPICRVTTTIVESEGKRWVEKTAAHPDAKKFLEAYPAKEQKLAQDLKGVLVIKSKFVDGKVVTPFIEGELLDDKFRQNLLDDKWEVCLELLLKVLKLIDMQKKSTQDFSSNSEFIKVFGSAWAGQYQALELGYLDYNLDNLIQVGDKTYLIDYEFTFDFPLPVDMVKCRFLLSYLQRYNQIFELLSKNHELTKLAVNFVVPTAWLKQPEISSILNKNLAKTLKSEFSFQTHFSVGYSGDGPIQKQITNQVDKPAVFLIDKLELERADHANELASLKIDIENLRTANQSLNDYINRIHRLMPVKLIRNTRSLYKKVGRKRDQ
ncbi:MAG TPA: hypothetical protein VLF39_04375 [Candidatus Saccharimonadales bacterium]|nr:hypothetical protein [Candidatus Saccharimonadales bacterium]